MIHANVPFRVRFKVYMQAFTTATLLDLLVVVTIDGVTKTRVEHRGGESPKFSKALREWGEAGVVKIVTTRTVKNLAKEVQLL